MKWMGRFFMVIVAFFLLNTYAYTQEDELPDYLRKAQTAVNKIAERSDETKQFTDDVLAAQNYLKLAETEYRKNLGWTGRLKPEAVPVVRHYSRMAELNALIVLSRLEKIRLDNERLNLEKSIETVRSRIKIFDNKNLEISQLRENLEKSKAEIASLNAFVSKMGSDAESLRKYKAELESENRKIKEELKQELKQKGDMESENRRLKEDVVTAKREKELLMEISKLPSVTARSTSDGIVMIIPRRILLKTAPKGPSLAPNSGPILEGIAGVIKAFPEYKASIKVYGFGGPVKQEDAKATEQMSRLLKDYMVSKANLSGESMDAGGMGQASPLFPKELSEMNKRVEIVFKRP